VQRVVVVGGGLAGGRVCEALRQQGFAGELTLVGDEDRPPYDRPPLSKAVLTGDLTDTTLPLQLPDVEILRPVRAERVDGSVLRTDAGDLPFDALVVATGATPVRLPGEGTLLLRTIGDALALRARLRPGLRLVIVGAGWIGAEVATAAATAGCQVTVVDEIPVPLGVALGPEVAAVLLPWWQQAGIRLELGVAVQRADGDRVLLADGRLLRADLVLVAVGVRAATDWLIGSGVDLDRGVITDERCRSVSRPDVLAVGDAAAWRSRRYGRLMRLHHWDDALKAPDTIAAVLTGDRDAVHDPVPYVWSDQFGRTIQLVGQHDPTDRLIWRGEVRADDWTACWVDDRRRLRGLATVGRPRDFVSGRRRIRTGEPCDLATLAAEQPSLQHA
jgi:3-phenylpropionate/trans-cinnamate dioxygenase ferredoxin reductase subunit